MEQKKCINSSQKRYALCIIIYEVGERNMDSNARILHQMFLIVGNKLIDPVETWINVRVRSYRIPAGRRWSDLGGAWRRRRRLAAGKRWREKGSPRVVRPRNFRFWKKILFFEKTKYSIETFIFLFPSFFSFLFFSYFIFIFVNGLF